MEEIQGSITLGPRPGFVVKTKILESREPFKYGVSTKVFINVCHDNQVPRPAIAFDPSIVFPLIIKNEWEIPLIVSNEKQDRDKKGQPSFVYDCCINEKSFQWCQTNVDLRSILIEWCIEAVEMMYELTLEREYSIPKMLSKGELSQTQIKQSELTEGGLQKKLQQLKANETLGLIEELKDETSNEEDPGQLPDLMNINNSDQNKPLIEEINDMKITEAPRAPKVEQKFEPAMKQRVHFVLSYPPLYNTDKQLVTVQSEQLDPTKVKAWLDHDQLVIENSNPNQYFDGGSSNQLLVPIKASNSTSAKCFHLKGSHTFKFFI